MTVTSLVAVVAPRTGKIIKNDLRLFERGENLIQNGISFCKGRIYADEKLTFLKRAWHLKREAFIHIYIYKILAKYESRFLIDGLACYEQTY